MAGLDYELGRRDHGQGFAFCSFLPDDGYGKIGWSDWICSLAIHRRMGTSVGLEFSIAHQLFYYG